MALIGGCAAAAFLMHGVAPAAAQTADFTCENHFQGVSFGFDGESLNPPNPNFGTGGPWTVAFEAGESIRFAAAGTADVVYEVTLTAGPSSPQTIFALGPGPMNTTFVAPTAGVYRFFLRVGFTGGFTSASVSVFTTCLTPGNNGQVVDLRRTSKAMTGFVLRQIVPENAKTVSDLINQRLHGNGTGAPSFAAHRGGARMSVQLADLARLRPQSTGRQRAGTAAATREAAAPEPDARLPFNVWFEGRALSAEGGRSGTRFDGTLYSVLGGFDYRIDDRLLAGVAVGHEGYDLDTGMPDGRFRGRGFTVGPYIGILVADALVLDVWAGGTFLDYRIREAGIAGEFDAQRWFVSANLTGTWRYGRWRIAPRVSVLYAEEKQPSYADSAGALVASQTIRLGRFAFGPEIGHAIGTVGPFMDVETFAALRGEYDFAQDGAETLNNGVVVDSGRLGARVAFGASGSLGRLRLRIEGNYNSIGRSDQNVWGGAIRVSLPF